MRISHTSHFGHHVHVAVKAVIALALLIVAAWFVGVAPAAAADLTLTFNTAPSSATAGANIPVVVTTSDHAGAGDTITLTTSPSRSGGQMTGYTATVGSDGSATFANFSINVAGTYEVTANDTSNSGHYASVDQTNVVISAGSAHQIAFSTQPPSSSTWNTTLTKFAVSVEDTYGNVVKSNGDVIALASSCPLGGTLKSTASSGVATFEDVQLTGGSSCKLTATDTSTAGLATTTSHTITMFGAPTKLAFSSPLPTTAATLGVAMPSFKVSVEDHDGVRVTSGTGAADDVVVSTFGAGCALSGTSVTAKADDGVATFTGVKFLSGSSCTLYASDASRTLTTADSAAVNVSTSAASKVGFTKEPSSGATAGAKLASFKVSVEEANGVAVTSGTGASDTISLASSCHLTGTTGALAVNGVATFDDVIVDTAGNCTLSASDATRTLGAASSTAIKILPSSPTHLSFTTAPPTASSSIATPLSTFRVAVEDVYDNVVTTGTGSSDTIFLTSPCTLSGTTSVVAVAGVATFSAATMTTTGACTLTAADLSRSATSAVTNVKVGKTQATLRITSRRVAVNRSLRLTTRGGTGRGAVTYAAANGTATGCVVNGKTLRAATQGTCLVTATKAAAGNYVTTSSVATTVVVGPPRPTARLVTKAVWSNRTETVRVLGSHFRGRPRVVSGVSGFHARVLRDTGNSLILRVTVKGSHRAGMRVMTIITANGGRTSVAYRLR